METKHERRMREAVENSSKAPKFRSWGPDPDKVKTRAPGGGAYRLVFVRAGGNVRVGHSDKAPADGVLVHRAKANAALFAVRYFPSRRGWRVIDVRNAMALPLQAGQQRVQWINAIWLDQTFPSEDAAVMRATLLCGS